MFKVGDKVRIITDKSLFGTHVRNTTFAKGRIVTVKGYNNNDVTLTDGTNTQWLFGESVVNSHIVLVVNQSSKTLTASKVKAKARNWKKYRKGGE